MKYKDTLDDFRNSPQWEQCSDVLDNHFPKGECLERGAAMVMLAELMTPITEYTKSAAREAIELSFPRLWQLYNQYEDECFNKEVNPSFREFFRHEKVESALKESQTEGEKHGK